MNNIDSFILNLEKLDKPFSKNRSRSYYRHHRNRSIRSKKEKISYNYWNYKYDGMYSKGKIHCSCSSCKYSKKFNVKKKTWINSSILMKEQCNDYFNSPS